MVGLDAAGLPVVELELTELSHRWGAVFDGRPVHAVVLLGGELLGSCVVPPVADTAELLRALAAGLEDDVRERVVAAAVGDERAWAFPSRTGPPVTVVVCTIDRPAALRRCLGGLVPQLGHDDELVVVDNAPSGSARRVTQRAGARWVHERRPGSSWARNRGAAEASHDVVAYIDDDCLPDPAWLDAIRAPFADADVDAVTGSVLARRADLLVPWYVDRRYPFHRGWTPVRRRGTTGHRGSPYDAWWLGTGASMAWRRGLLDRLGGFDPALGAGTRCSGNEELDLFRRAVRSGATIEYRPDALVLHDHPETWRDFRRMLVGYSIGEGAHLAKQVFEEGRRRGVLVALEEYRWQMAKLPGDVAAAARRKPHLPVLATVAHLPAVALGAARFVRERGRLRGAA